MTFSWAALVARAGGTFTVRLDRGHLPMLSLQSFLTSKLRVVCPKKKNTQIHRERLNFCRKKR